MEEFERTNERIIERIRKRKEKRRKELLLHVALGTSCVIIFLFIIGCVVSVSIPRQQTIQKYGLTKYIEHPPEYTEQLLTPNEYSRPQIPLEKVCGIVVHYTANPGTTAQQNRNYFEGLAESKETKVSSHFIIGLAGEIIQCVPLDEVAYASNQRNADTISIECCIDNDEGRFNQATYDALVELTAWLVGEYRLEIDDIIRHYDVTGKNCPKYFVEHESAWEDFKLDVEKYINTYGIKMGASGRSNYSGVSNPISEADFHGLRIVIMKVLNNYVK